MSDYPQHIYEAYDDMLDDCYPEVVVFSWSVSPSVAFKRIDPIAYEVGLNDWLSHLEACGEYDPVGEDFCDWEDMEVEE
jgi:hypothetical protein